MTPETFIRKHIIDHLTAEGFPSAVARGADEAIAHYRRMSQPSKKGGAFDDCLARARQWAHGQTAAERKTGKKKAGKSGTPNRLL